jgi:hypothetical protein
MNKSKNLPHFVDTLREKGEAVVSLNDIDSPSFESLTPIPEYTERVSLPHLTAVYVEGYIRKNVEALCYESNYLVGAVYGSNVYLGIREYIQDDA